MLQFPHITRSAEGLSVSSLIQTSAHDRNYVVEHELFRAVTPSAFRVGPVGLLPWSKANAVTLLLSRLWITLEFRKHHVSIDAPPLFESSAHLGASFRRMLISFRWPRSLTWSRSGSFSIRDAIKRFLAMVLAPKGIVLASHGGANALSFAACNLDASFDLRKSAINWISANLARIGLSFTFFGHGSLGNFG